MKKIILTIVLFLALFSKTFAADFVVRDIQFEGLQRISVETARSFVPVQPGELLTSAKTGELIRNLYKSGFFEHISLERRGNTLIIHVVERWTIGQIKLSGNHMVPTEKLMTVMKSLDIAEGRVYNRAVVDKIKQSLLNQYYEVGRYNAHVTVTETPMSRNRVLIKIDISEGLVAKILKINIIGNQAFSEKILTKQLEISTPGLFTFLTKKDLYEQEKLEKSLENLRNYYFNHGYLKFAIKSSQVAISPDHKSMYITIVVSEGQPYTIKGYELTGDYIVPREQVMRKMNIQVGEVFSRQKMLDSQKAATEMLGDIGYVSATIELIPTLDDKTHQVFLNFHMKPGKRSYVRHISFVDNTRTNDDVLRRELPQMEGAVISSSKLEEGKHRLKLLPFIKEVNVTATPVPEHDDQVDVQYKVSEDNSANATFSIGYSQLEHWILGIGFNQKNFLGSGKTLGVNVTESRFQKYYGLSYTNPYYTPDGISRTITLSGSKFDPRAAELASYNTNEYDVSVLYSIPVSQERDVVNRVQLGYGYQNTLLKLSSTNSLQLQDFVMRNGRQFQQANLMAGYSRDARDKAIFPTSGSLHTIGTNIFLPLTGKSLKYYSFAWNSKWYQPIYGGFIATARGGAGYGNAFNGVANYPFFKNFFAGGFDTVRGFAPNTLGPRDSSNNPGNPTGGNLLADASLGLIVPNHISENLRTSVFIDGGNVYNTFDNRKYQGSASGGPRYAAGVEADWLTPLGLISVAFAKVLNPQLHDETKFFDFSLGANFG